MLLDDYAEISGDINREDLSLSNNDRITIEEKRRESWSLLADRIKSD